MGLGASGGLSREASHGLISAEDSHEYLVQVQAHFFVLLYQIMEERQCVRISISTHTGIFCQPQCQTVTW